MEVGILDIDLSLFIYLHLVLLLFHLNPWASESWLCTRNLSTLLAPVGLRTLQIAFHLLQTSVLLFCWFTVAGLVICDISCCLIFPSFPIPQPSHPLAAHTLTHSHMRAPVTSPCSFFASKTGAAPTPRMFFCCNGNKCADHI